MLLPIPQYRLQPSQVIQREKAGARGEERRRERKGVDERSKEIKGWQRKWESDRGAWRSERVGGWRSKMTSLFEHPSVLLRQREMKV